eukprot:Colp12_sorted_trinity150504_noHs@34735
MPKAAKTKKGAVPVKKAARDAPTQFQSRIYKLLQTVPSGQVTTYKHLAAAAGCGSTQAVGQALKRNPWGLFDCQDPVKMVPCHRVVSSDLSLGGFSGQTDPKSCEIQR